MKKLLSNENKNKQHKESLKSPVDPETWIWKSWATVSHPWASWKWMIWSDKSKRAEHGGDQLTSACPELMCCNSISLKSLGQDFGCEGQKPGALSDSLVTSVLLLPLASLTEVTTKRINVPNQGHQLNSWHRNKWRTRNHYVPHLQSVSSTRPRRLLWRFCSVMQIKPQPVFWEYRGKLNTHRRKRR